MPTYISRRSSLLDSTTIRTQPLPIFRLKRNHPLGKTKIKTLYKLSTEKKLSQDNTPEEKLGEQDSPPN